MRLAATRDATGYLAADGALVLDNADYAIYERCAHCHKARWCGWYTGHGPTIRWYCDACAGTPCGAVPWEQHEPGKKAAGPAEIVAPERIQEGVHMSTFWMVYVDGKPDFTRKQATEPVARGEAERLAKLHPGVKVFVLEATGHVLVPPAVIHERYSDIPF